MRMMLIMIVAMGPILAGCGYVGIHSSQLTAITSAIYPDAAEEPAPLWVVEYGGYASVLQPVLVETSTLFVNETDSVSFNGWTITVVSGLDSFIPAWEIRDLGNERSFSVNGLVVETHQCDPWVKKEFKAGVSYEQKCLGRSSYTNTILIGSLGEITAIEQVVDSSLMTLRLRLNN